MSFSSLLRKVWRYQSSNQKPTEIYSWNTTIYRNLQLKHNHLQKSTVETQPSTEIYCWNTTIYRNLLLKHNNLQLKHNHLQKSTVETQQSTEIYSWNTTIYRNLLLKHNHLQKSTVERRNNCLLKSMVETQPTIYRNLLLKNNYLHKSTVEKQLSTEIYCWNTTKCLQKSTVETTNICLQKSIVETQPTIYKNLLLKNTTNSLLNS